MTYKTERITPAPQLVKPRTGPIKGSVIHSTRGGTSSPEVDYSATKNWFTSPNNMARNSQGQPLGYGGCASRIIGPAGEMTIVMPDDQMPTYSAGYGAIGPPVEFLVDQHYISYELAQPTINTPYTDPQIDRIAMEIALDAKTYGFPIIMRDFRDDQTVPLPGVTRHDRTANGRKLGKSDPGHMFPEVRFVTLARAYLEGVDDMKVIAYILEGQPEQALLIGAHLEHVDSRTQLDALKRIYQRRGVEWVEVAVKKGSPDWNDLQQLGGHYDRLPRKLFQ